ncbi:hypothetical protein BJ741DRAFT_663565 [Chytriomyces cf. hyalinus JEL632]|nr:hypothetical protein BJ741DRAFT_663565 [Chytriomyces cf. hyalinus JEL632]
MSDQTQDGELFLCSSIQGQPVEGKGTGLICIDPNGIEDGIELLRELPFESWGSNYNPATIAAKLIFKSRSDKTGSTQRMLCHLFPTQLSQIPLETQENVPESTIAAIESLVIKWETLNQCNDPHQQQTALPPLTRETFLRHYFAVECNSFPTGLLLTLSLANHSCVPNCTVFQITNPTTKSTHYNLWSTRAISHGEECTISYIDLVKEVHTAAERNQYLQSKFGFSCTCPRCRTLVVSTGIKYDHVSVQGAEVLQNRVVDEMCDVFGVEGEDLVCSAFIRKRSENSCTRKLVDGTDFRCIGRVKKETRVCETCHILFTLVELEEALLLGNDAVKKVKATVAEGWKFISHFEASGGSMEGISGLEEHKMRLQKLKEESLCILHETHFVFHVMDTLTDKLGSLVRRERWNERRRKALKEKE